MLETCTLAVFSLMNRILPICGLVRPRASNSSTSSSRRQPVLVAAVQARDGEPAAAPYCGQALGQGRHIHGVSEGPSAGPGGFGTVPISLFQRPLDGFDPSPHLPYPVTVVLPCRGNVFP